MEQKVREKVEQGGLLCQIIIEILGAPKEHIEETMRLVLKKLKDEKGVDVISGTVHPPKEQDKLFATFAELEVLFKDISTLTRICFDYMPSSFEILEPSGIRMQSLDVSNFINDMMLRLHETDMALKEVNAANILLEKNSSNLMKNFVRLVLKSGAKSADEIAVEVGVPSSQLVPFLELYLKEGLVKRQGDKWERT